MLHAFGKHLIFDFKKSNNIDCPIKIQNFVNDLVNILKMTKYGETHIQKFGDTPAVAGYSFFQLIQESNISGHFCSYDFIMEKNGKKFNNKGAGYIDIFSCKDYNTQDVINCIEKHFKPETYVYKEIERI